MTTAKAVRRDWPRKVFLESTALFQLGSKLEKPEFAKLKDRREYLKFDLFVSEVSWAEYLRQRTDKIDVLSGDIKSILSRLSEWNLSPKDVMATHTQVKDCRNNAADFFGKKAEETGIQILPIPDIDVRRLFRMAIDRIPPFEQSKDDKTEKGFRDALIMFTILMNIQGQPEDFSLVVSNDVLLTRGLNNHVEEFMTNLTVVPTLDDAIAHIDARVDTWYQAHLLNQSEEAKAQLEKFKEQIAEQVSAIRELTDFDLGIGGAFWGLGGGSQPLEIAETIERVNSLKVEKIDSAVWSDKDKPESRILFRIRCTANVTTSSSGLSPWASPSRYTVGGEKQSSSFLTSFLGPPSKQERQRTLPLTLYGEAKFQRTDGEWKLSSLKVDKSQPSPDDLATLLRMVI